MKLQRWVRKLNSVWQKSTHGIRFADSMRMYLWGKQTMGDTRKYRNIDALRTFGCLAIIAWHVKANTGFSTGGGVLDKVIPSFDYLVYLFMIISGFGMCNGYYQKLKTGTYSIDAFYSKRYKRTVPFFALLILLNCVTEFAPKTVCEGLMEITMLFGFLPNNTLSTIGVAWTLGAIFAFYIIFPFIVFLLYSPKRGIVSFVISLVITYMCQCYFMTERFVTENFVMRHSFLYCLPYFLIGGIVYLYKDEIERFVNQFKVISFCVVLALTVGYYITPDVINSINIVVIKTLILYTGWLGLALGYDNRLMNNKFTNYISNLSMEMYLSHMVVFRIVEKIGIMERIESPVIRYMTTYLLLVMLLVMGLTIYRKAINKLDELR